MKTTSTMVFVCHSEQSVSAVKNPSASLAELVSGFLASLAMTT
ncbi:MAG: hypothetical protein SNJ55_09300 [Chloroherpetonaceae bacterium]